MTVECLVPSLVTLRMKLCPSQISVGAFWKIYLFLLHPKLGHDDSEQLSTPQASFISFSLSLSLSVYKSSELDWIERSALMVQLSISAFQSPSSFLSPLRFSVYIVSFISWLF